MKEYIDYKAWWIAHEAPSKIGSLYWGETAEECFKQHVNDIGVYGLMEILAGWEE